MENINETIKDVVSIIEEFYTVKISETSKKLDNIKRINIDSLVDLVKKEIKKGNIKSKADIVRYIESIIPD